MPERNKGTKLTYGLNMRMISILYEDNEYIPCFLKISSTSVFMSWLYLNQFRKIKCLIIDSWNLQAVTILTRVVHTFTS